MSNPGVKTLTIRLPEALYRSGAEMARRRQVSMNALLQEGLAAVLAAEQERALYDAFTLAGADPEEADVGFALAAQSEVALDGRAN